MCKTRDRKLQDLKNQVGNRVDLAAWWRDMSDASCHTCHNFDTLNIWSKICTRNSRDDDDDIILETACDNFTPLSIWSRICLFGNWQFSSVYILAICNGTIWHQTNITCLPIFPPLCDCHLNKSESEFLVTLSDDCNLVSYKVHIYWIVHTLLLNQAISALP